MMAKEDQRRTHVRTDRKEIAEQAYKLWRAADRPAGRDLEFWFKAEAELLAARHARPTNVSSAPNEGRQIPDGRNTYGSYRHQDGWINKDSQIHTVTCADKKFHSRPLQINRQFPFTFKDPGTYNYYCSIHPCMKGKIFFEK